MLCRFLFLFIGILSVFLVQSNSYAKAISKIEGLSNVKSEVVGWHWYNEPLKTNSLGKKKKLQSAQTMTDKNLLKKFHRLTPIQQLKILQAVTLNRRVKAVLSGNVDDIASYKLAQDFWVQRASIFTVGWEKMLLRYPERDYSLVYPNSNLLASTQQVSRHQAEARAIQRLAKHNGLLFFYRGKVVEDRLFSEIVKRFAVKHGLSVIPVSMDGATVTVFGNNQADIDHKRADELGISHFPALVLVNTATRRYQIASYGLQSESKLANRLLKLANDWQAGF